MSMVNVLYNLRRLRKRVPPRIMNSLIRALTSGVVMETTFAHSGRCLLSPHCGGRHDLLHYLRSSCWHSPKVQRRYKLGLECIEPFRGRGPLSKLEACAHAIFILCHAINYARTTLGVVEWPVEAAMKRRVVGVGFMRGFRHRV